VIVFLKILPVFLTAFLLTACADNEWEPLDQFREGDIRAKPGDIKITPETKIYVRTSYHPRIRNLLKSSRSNRSIEEQISVHEGELIARILQDRGHPKSVKGGSKPIPNKIPNLLVTQNIEINSEGKPYRLTMTARQGSYYLEQSVERKKYIPGPTHTFDFVEGPPRPPFKTEDWYHTLSIDKKILSEKLIDEHLITVTVY